MVRIGKPILIVGAMVSLIASLAGCHGSSSRTYEMRWQSTADEQRVLEFKLDGPTVVGKLSMVLFQSRVKGTYVLNVLRSGDSATEGLIQDREGYTLVSKDGKQQRWSLAEDPSFLKDESGTIWKPGRL
jgi:hypothetical protein